MEATYAHRFPEQLYPAIRCAIASAADDLQTGESFSPAGIKMIRKHQDPIQHVHEEWTVRKYRLAVSKVENNRILYPFDCNHSIVQHCPRVVDKTATFFSTPEPVLMKRMFLDWNIQ